MSTKQLAKQSFIVMYCMHALHHMPETENAAMFACTLSLMLIKSQLHAKSFFIQVWTV